MNPKVFVSSTIIDFEDLRGALKYYLEEYGYDVQMSEYPNFNIDSDTSAIEACINNLINCQYFILLIGYRRGSLYKENLSVTNLEYRAAKTLIERGHPLRILSFVRKPIWLLKNDRKGLIKNFKQKSEEYSKIISETGSTIIDDPNYIVNFLQEISEGIKVPESNSPANNWIIDFNNFEDIIVALKNTFHITESLQEKKLKKLLKNELENNRNKFINSVNGINAKRYFDFEPYKISQKNIMEYLAETFFPKFFDNEEKPIFVENGIVLDKIDANRFIILYSAILPMMGMSNLETRFLDKTVNEGLFITYDIKRDDFDINLLSLSFTNLLDWINAFKNNYNTEFYNTFKKEMARIATNGSLHQPYVNISMESCSVILGLVYGIRILDLINAILSVLNENDFQLLIDFDFSSNFFKKYL